MATEAHQALLDLAEISPTSRFHVGWRAVTYGLVLLGFTGLAFTGEIHPIAIVIFLAVWCGGLAMQRIPAWWPHWMSHVIVWAVLIPIALIALNGHFVSLLYLLIFLAMFKCLNLREPIDHLHALLLAYFMLLATSIITTSISYLLLVLAFIAFILLELICFNLARDLERAGSPSLVNQFRRGQLTMANRRGLIRQLARKSLLLGFVVLVLAFALFLVMPQYSAKGEIAGPLGKLRQQQQERLSGYGEEVTFGVFDRLALDSTQVLSLQVRFAEPGNHALPSAVHLRGTSLDTYDERRWSQRTDKIPYQSRSWRRITLPVASALTGPVVLQSVDQNVNLTGRLFGLGQPFMFQFNYDRPVNLQFNYRAVSLMRMVDRGGWNQDFAEQHLQYNVSSYLVEEATPLLRKLAQQTADGSSGGGTLGIQRDPSLQLDGSNRAAYTALPATPLSQQITNISQRQANAPQPIGKILQLEDWLQADFEYSLSPETPRGMHPLEAFLTKTHKGHCEYFATAFCLLLRAQGIPARLVTGFYTSEYNSATQRFLVRQSDAHAWTEVWLEGLGWLMLDPTPAQNRGRLSAPSAAPGVFKRLSNKVQAVWQQYILYYSNSQQEQLYVSLLTSPKLQKLTTLLDRFTDFTGLGSVEKDWTNGESNSHRIIRYIQFGGVLVGLILLLLLYRLLRAQQQMVKAQQSTIPFMNSLLHRLHELGWHRLPGQTPAELLLQVEQQTDGRWGLTGILEIYHRHRFAGQQPSPDELQHIDDTIRRIE